MLVGLLAEFATVCFSASMFAMRTVAEKMAKAANRNHYDEEPVIEQEASHKRASFLFSHYR